MRNDLEQPARFGIKQSVGDTVGPGGLSRGLRNIPIVADIARRMEAICPDAWLLNYTNPMTTLTRAVSRESNIKVIGLCHEYVGVLHRLAQVIGVEPTEIETTVAGINHLPWILDLKVSGEDAMPRIRELAVEILASRGDVLGYKKEDSWSTIDRGMVKSRLLQVYGALPAAGDRHLAEFFSFFLTEATGYGQQYGIELTSIEERYQWRARDKARALALLNDQHERDSFLRSASHEAASQIIAAVIDGGTYRGIMNLPNQAQISNLLPGVVVETLGRVTANEAQGDQVGALPPAIHSVVARHVSNQEILVEAALTGDRQLALQVLLNDPMVNLEPDRASELLEAMLSANQPYLPLFH
jgi:alpha-galactosidase/6-phospho-beta-glucosidase family protein